MNVKLPETIKIKEVAEQLAGRGIIPNVSNVAKELGVRTSSLCMYMDRNELTPEDLSIKLRYRSDRIKGVVERKKEIEKVVNAMRERNEVSSLTAIADKLGKSKQALSSFFRYYGIPFPKNELWHKSTDYAKNRKKLLKVVDNITKKGKELTYEELGKEMHVTTSSARSTVYHISEAAKQGRIDGELDWQKLIKQNKEILDQLMLEKIRAKVEEMKQNGNQVNPYAVGCAVGIANLWTWFRYRPHLKFGDVGL